MSTAQWLSINPKVLSVAAYCMKWIFWTLPDDRPDVELFGKLAESPASPLACTSQPFPERHYLCWRRAHTHLGVLVFRAADVICRHYLWWRRHSPWCPCTPWSRRRPPSHCDTARLASSPPQPATNIFKDWLTATTTVTLPLVQKFCITSDQNSVDVSATVVLPRC